MIRTLFITSLLIAASVAPASVIYSHTQNFADDKYPVWSYNNGYTDEYAADGFILKPGSNTIRQVHWWGSYGYRVHPDEIPWDIEDFVISIYADNGGKPALDPIFEVQVTPYLREFSNPGYFDASIYRYSAHIGNVSLQANMPYYLSITSTRRWLWCEACHNCSTSFVRTNSHASWESDWLRLNLAFNLTDDPLPVPEPSSLILLSAGLAGLAIWRRGHTGA